jgi:hypothetical protein
MAPSIFFEKYSRKIIEMLNLTDFTITSPRRAFPPVDKHQQSDPDNGGNRTDHCPLALAGHTASTQDIDPLQKPDYSNQYEQNTDNC